MALSDRQILKEMDKGDIIIHPFNKMHLSTSSYDVSLGKYYFRERSSKYHLPIYNIWSKSHTNHVWGTEPFLAEPAKNVFRKLNFSWMEFLRTIKSFFLIREKQSLPIQMNLLEERSHYYNDEGALLHRKEFY